MKKTDTKSCVSSKSFFPHVIYFGSQAGPQLYWDITRTSLDLERNKISIHLGNGLEYRLSIPYLLSPLEANPYAKSESMANDSTQQWGTRSIYWYSFEGRQKGHYQRIRIYDKKRGNYYWCSAETLLMRSEPAYEDFTGERYPEYCPGYHEQVLDSLRNNPDCVEIIVSPGALKKRGFFHVVEACWFRRAGIILFFTQGGDQYGILEHECTEAKDVLCNIGVDKFKYIKKQYGNGHGRLSISADGLSADEQNKLDGYLETVALELDYRFRGHKKEYYSNRRWHVRPTEYLFSSDYVWPSNYTYEYA